MPDYDPKTDIRKTNPCPPTPHPVDQCAQSQYPTAGCCAPTPAAPRRLLEERLDYHNRMANGINRLLRAIPQELQYEAADALASIILESRPKW